VESNKAFYDRISKAYDLIADHDEHLAREAGERSLGLLAGERVLELGFGTGNSIVNLARLVGDSGNVVGIDVSSGMLEVAQGKVDREGLGGRVELKIADARELPYGPETFDAVFASFTLELFPEDQIPDVLAEVDRVLRPGGRLGIVSMAQVKRDDHPGLLERAYIWMHRHFPHIVDCRPIDVAQVVTAAGFEVVEQTDFSIWTMPVALVISRKLV
jgi:demethylmenaquinone methyltransferase/2-methoxy-6-polyprenyl-1,4-benzoquinol methylase